MLNDTSLDLFLTRQLLTFMIICFQSFENDLVRTECLKLVTIGIWTHLAYESTREQLFDSYPNLLKLWNSYQKKWKAAGKQVVIIEVEQFNQSENHQMKQRNNNGYLRGIGSVSCYIVLLI